MAQYIEKEALIKLFYERGYFKHAIYKSVIEDFPTEDVVPKSEVEKLKAETIKNFAEKLKEEFDGNPYVDYYVVRDCIDDLVKEMTESEDKR